MKSLNSLRYCALLAVGWLLLAAPGARAQQSASPAITPHGRLQAVLERYYEIADSGGWPPVPAGPTIGPGSRGARVSALSQRLAATGDLDSRHAGKRVYDATLRAAVRAFQERHGLVPDALVGRRTLAAMNVPASVRVAQLRLNVERMRTLLDAAPDTFLLVNIPAFEAYLVRDGATVWTTRVIVGETENETPLLDEQIEYLVLNPTWTVPRSIATKELLPKIQADPGWLERGNYDVLDQDGRAVDTASIQWTALDVNDFPYVLVQRAGPVNELGQVKFMLPNDHGVCIHDTSSPYLFDNASRAFSHGCIRMDRPVDFAERLLEPLGWTRGEIDAQLGSGETRTIILDQPLPVLVAYMTAGVDSAGTVSFYSDLYDKDGLGRSH